MTNPMTEDEYAKKLGRLIANLNSLEFILRAFLQNLPSAKPLELPNGKDIYSFPAGTELPESEITNYDTLEKLIEKFNVFANQRGFIEIDKRIIEIRNALAHGRVSSPTISDNLRLVKFSRPVRGKVKITFNEVLSRNWFEVNIKLVYDAIIFVNKWLNT
jgi:hypothetical protein